jgi:DNA-binding response OmpR family regulator
VSSSCENTIQVLIYRLRRRVEPDPANPVYIRNRRGLGYVFVPHRPDKTRQPRQQ